MPYSEQDCSRTGRGTAADPSTEPIDALLTRLGTDAAVGLSPKEAARRRESRDTRPLFRALPRTYGACLLTAMKEPALCLLFAVSVISLFFERVALGLFSLLITAGHTALCAYFLYRADRVDAAMQSAYDTPLCRVLRGGRLLRRGAEGLVPGDIILLAEGDIIPADCRLLRTDGFAVSERELGADSGSPSVYLEKDAGALPETAEALRHSPVNMVYAGGMAAAGRAMAVVLAVGNDTHLGGLLGHIPSVRQRTPMVRLGNAAKGLSVYNLCLFCLTVPLTALGIFTVGDTYEFLDIFLSALALASVTLTEHTLCRMIHLAAAARRAAALDRDRENSAAVKSAATLESLSAMTDLLLMGTAALHDGRCHPEALYVGDKVYRCDRPEADEDVHRVAEYLYLYRKAMETLPTAGQGEIPYGELISAFCYWAEPDVRALDLKIKEIRAEAGGASGIFPTAEGSRRVLVRLTRDFSEVETCTHVHDGVSNPATHSAEGRERLNTLYRLYRESVRQGSVPLFILTEWDGVRTVHAMLTYAPHTCRKTAGAVKSLEAAGIRVTALLRDVSDVHARTLAACGLTDRVSSNRPAPEGESRIPAVEAMEEGCRAFEGCSEDYVMDCIRDLKAKGRTVGVLSVDGGDIRLLAEADVAFTCAPALYPSAEAGYPVMDPRDTDGGNILCDRDGSPEGILGSDRSRRACHVAVSRTSAVGGGLLGVLTAVRAAESFVWATDHTLRFILLSQVVRLIMTVLPLCLGLSISSAPALLLSGYLLDLLVMAAAAQTSAEHIRPAEQRGKASTRGWLSVWRAHRAELISVSAVAVLLWVAAGIAVLFEAEIGGDLLYYGLLGLLSLQLALFFTGHFRRDGHRLDGTTFLTGLCLVLVYVGALAATLVNGLTLLWALVIPPAGALAYVALRAILVRIMGADRA